MEISMKLVYNYMAIFLNMSPTSNHLHPLQKVENCDSNSRLVVDVDDIGKHRLERIKTAVIIAAVFHHKADFISTISSIKTSQFTPSS